jgi:protein phosphatase
MSARGRRRRNEDAVLVATLSNGAELVAVADGMGGYAGGEVASRCALEVLRTALEAGSELADAVRAANAAVFQEASRSKKHHGMGTTLVALLRRGPRYVLVNVGDSRAYRIDSAGIQQLTRDHSFVADAVRAGHLSAEDAEKSRWRNAVTRAVGTQAELDVDCYGPFDALQPHTVVLCTDGLYRAISADDLRQAVLAPSPPDDAVRQLAAAAYDAGSDDNISVVILRFGSDAASPSVSAAPDQPRAATGPASVDGAATPRPSAPAARLTAPWTEPSPAHRRRRSERWTLIEILLIFLGLVVLTYAVLRILPF